MKKPSFERILDMQQLLFAFTEIDRLIHFPDSKRIDRRENNAEHSFSLAVMAWFLSQYYPILKKHRLIQYALVHDLVEVYAGDEQAVGRTKAAEKAKKEREHKAYLRLKKEWTDFPDMLEHIEGYETKKDNEAKFIYALDKLMPLLLNMLSEGKTWRKYRFTQNDVMTSKDTKVTISPEINELWQKIRPEVLNSGFFHNQEVNLEQRS